MKIELRQGIFIEGFDTSKEMVREQIGRNKELEFRTTLYEGKTSEVTEEIAKECAELLTPGHPISLWRNYKYNKPQPVSFTCGTAKDSIQSACSQEFCIIYKTE